MIKGVVNYFKCLLNLSDCKNVHRLLFDYVEGNLPPEKHAKLTTHLRDCPLCLEYVNTYKLTVQACHQCAPTQTDMPPELADKLRAFIQKEL